MEPATSHPLRRCCQALLLLVSFCLASGAAAYPEGPETAVEAGVLPADVLPLLSQLEQQGWLLHGQMTVVVQGHPRFRSPYQAAASLDPGAGARNTESLDLILGRRLWQDAEIVLVPMVTRGFGLSNTLGAASFPNGEAFRLGTREPYLSLSRAFLRQTIALSSETEEITANPLRFSGPVARERVTITIGKMSVWDIFDDNRYAHDPRLEFLNWGMIAAGAFDYAADARGFTNGIVLEWENGVWALRQGVFMVAARANGEDLDQSVFKGYQSITEIDRFWRLFDDRPGALRVLFGASSTLAPRWDEMTAATRQSLDPPLRAQRHSSKPNFGMNAEQEFTDILGGFIRFGWNNGLRRNWMFTEQDWSASAGIALNGKAWQRDGDTIGLAFNIGGITKDHQRFLEAGGIGFITGDGRLRYAPEKLVETYYDVKLAEGLNAAANIQYLQNPAYNADRGPAVILALRLHAAF